MFGANVKSALSKTFLLFALFSTLFFIPGCGGGSNGGGGVNSNVQISVSTLSGTLPVNRSQTFIATVLNTTNTAVTWSVQEGVNAGTITAQGIYTAPNTPGTYHIVATSQADSSKFASAAITVIPVVSVSIAPTAVTLSPGGTQAFTATVQNSINTAVNWSIQEGGAGGSVVSGAYTAPNVAGVFHVVATSQADNVAFAVATVTVQAGSASGTIQ